jgi:hypothetical protein
MTGTFNRVSQLALVASASARLTARADLAFFSYITTQNINGLVVDLDILVYTELAELGSRNITAASWCAAFRIHIIGHAFFSD